MNTEAATVVDTEKNDDITPDNTIRTSNSNLADLEKQLAGKIYNK